MRSTVRRLASNFRLRSASASALLGLALSTGCGGPATSAAPEPAVADRPSTVVAAADEPDRKPSVEEVPGSLAIPDVELVDQDGKATRFYSDLVKDKVVAINFLFTTCKGVCPPLGANFSALRKVLDERSGLGISLISISVDPVADTPQRLKAWAGQFNAGDGWTLLTGEKARVDRLLKALQVFTADKNGHSPFVLIGDPSGTRWRRVQGLTPPETLAGLLLDARGKPAAPQAEHSPAKRYFGDVPLVDQHGQPVRLYSDLLAGKVVVIHCFFGECKGACPVMLGAYTKLQERFRDRLGKDLFLISMSVDPEQDTPEKLEAMAQALKAKPGWSFVTGARADVDRALTKLGLYASTRETHPNTFIIGNEPTGLWKKATVLSRPDDLIRIVEDVLNDRG
jgi:protein SCO1